MSLSRTSTSLGGETVATPAMPPDLRIYAVGDVHGRHDLLMRMQDLIIADIAANPACYCRTLFLGDLVDRGPQSAAILEYLSAGGFATPISVLRGNHEELFLSFLNDPRVLEGWRKVGGLETLHSYGIDVSEVLLGCGFDRAREQLVHKLPSAHQRFVEMTANSDQYGDYFFCHAGVRPHIALDEQKSEDLLWIGDEFLRFRGNFGKIVVHGHTPVDRPDVRTNRINIDTGAFATSVLTALVLEGQSQRFLSATPCSADQRWLANW
jgi:serine/threonine protein phosphatase 1